MKAYLEIELKWDNTRQLMKLWDNIMYMGVSKHGVPKKYAETFKPMPSTGWIAEIIGFDPKFKYQRDFVKFKKDYSRANSKGSRGVYAVYILESGKIYDIKDNKFRYFAIVENDGNIKEIPETEVLKCLKARLE